MIDSTEILLEEIKRQFKNLNQFSIASGINYQTLVTVFKKGILSTSITIIIKICSTLGISTDELIAGKIVKTVDTEKYKKNILFEKIESLNERQSDLLSSFVDYLIEMKDDN